MPRPRVGIFALHADARFVYDGLTSEGLPLVILSGIAGLAAFGLLVRGLLGGFEGRLNQLLRPAAVGAVVTVVWGFFVAQHPYMLPTSLTIDEAAGDPASLTAVIVVFAIAAVVILPSIALLYWLSQRRALE